MIVSTLTSCNCKKETLMGIGCAIRAAASAMQVKTGKNMTNTTITHGIEKFNPQDYLQKI
ncbi:hypothetical protein AGMMS49532_00820 [Endomicrobiia bacterium]|nr:hypothetical protein AGMMS49532_00820 [Endomicrobiia bacterium]GHT23275.1 hypothetical protein AGMMS49953_03550 [Endomicrobiia bacterium]